MQLVSATGSDMIHMDFLSRVVRCAILSARVKRSDIKPLSLFIVAPIECGKTQLALENAGDKPLILSDISGIGLLESLHQEKTVTHVVINDLAAVTGHKSSVSKLTISILNALAEEGCFRIGLPRMQHLSLEGRRIGVLTCCTPDLTMDNRQWWVKSGFLSRMLQLQFTHGVSLTAAIHTAIKKDQASQRSTSFQVPEIPIYVTIPPSMATRLQKISLVIAKHYKELGYRRHKQMRALACGAALLRTWKNPIVNNRDVELVEEALPYLTGGKEI